MRSPLDQTASALSGSSTVALTMRGTIWSYTGKRALSTCSSGVIGAIPSDASAWPLLSRSARITCTVSVSKVSRHSCAVMYVSPSSVSCAASSAVDPGGMSALSTSV